MIVANLIPDFSSLLIALSLVSLAGMVLCLREAESESTRQPPQPEPSGLFHLILRVLVRITNRSREAMVPMQQPSGYALRAAGMKTVCSPDSGPWWASP